MSPFPSETGTAVYVLSCSCFSSTGTLVQPCLVEPCFLTTGYISKELSFVLLQCDIITIILIALSLCHTSVDIVGKVETEQTMCQRTTGAMHPCTHQSSRWGVKVTNRIYCNHACRPLPHPKLAKSGPLLLPLSSTPHIDFQIASMLIHKW